MNTRVAFRNELWVRLKFFCFYELTPSSWREVDGLTTPHRPKCRYCDTCCCCCAVVLLHCAPPWPPFTFLREKCKLGRLGVWASSGVRYSVIQCYNYRLRIVSRIPCSMMASRAVQWSPPGWNFGNLGIDTHGCASCSDTVCKLHASVALLLFGWQLRVVSL